MAYGKNEQSRDTKRPKGLSDDEVLELVEPKVREGVGWYDSKLSRERERVLDYYNLKLPARQATGKSPYVSTDVYDAVEAMKAQLLETFAGNPDSLISFPPQREDDIEGARIATEYCSYQIHRLNDGYDVFAHAIHDGLTGRVGITKVYWEKIEEKVDEEIPEATLQDIQALAARDDIPELEVEETVEGSGIFSGTMTRTIDRSKVALCPVAPEEFVISPRAASIKKAEMVDHRTLKTKAELIEEGYDKKKVDSINWDDAKSLETAPEVLARHDPVESAQASLDNPVQPEVQKVMLHETFLKMNMKDGRGVRLWKVCYAGKVLLDKEEVDCAPFMAFIPLPIPHAFHGNNFAARVIPTQNARTVLTRAILDHASVTTTPRWGVVKGGLLNPKEMLDNRLGGIVNLQRPDAIKPLDQFPLNPFVFQTLEMLKMNKEESTGISALSQGLNKDAISTQNSQGLVQDLVTLSQQRQKIVARNFAFGYLIPLYLEVYRLVLANEKQEKIVELTGNFVPVDPTRWQERLDCKVSINLGYGEKDKQASKYMQAYTMLASDPGLAPVFQLKNRHKMMTDALKMASFENYAEYLSPPEEAPPPQPDPLKVKELEIKDKTAMANVQNAQTKAQEAQTKAQIEMLKAQMEQMKAQLQAVLDVREADRLDADVANDIDVSQRETEMLEEAPPPKEGGTAIISPNS
jgi:hypothetical protein